MYINKKNLIQTLPLLTAIFFFIGFGLFHLTKFETTDEHFWKYDRIKKYYNGIHDGLTENDWKKTRINDKPGVLVAILSGIGLPFTPNPEEHRNVAMEEATRYYDADKDKSVKLYDIFFTERTKQINFALRLPILLFNAIIILPLLFYCMWHAFSPRIAQIAIILIGLNPILIGISQIINPDAVFWSTSAVGLISFFAYLRRKEKKFIVICAIATGLSLLSKYTANLLFVFYPIIYLLHANFEKISLTIKEYVKAFLLITVGSWIIFAAFMPAVIQKPAHFLYGTLYSPVLSSFVDPVISLTRTYNIFFTQNDDYKTIPLFLLSLALFILITVIVPVVVAYISKQGTAITKMIPKLFAIIFILIAITSFINVWFDTPFFPLEDIKERSQELDKLSFPQIDHYPTSLQIFFGFTIQSQNIIFSLHPLVLIAVIAGAILLLTRATLSFRHALYFPFIALLVFIVGGLMSDIFVNVRYSIMLYVPFALTASIIIVHLIKRINTKRSLDKQRDVRIFIAVLFAIILTHVASLIQVKPHYFNYENFLLPKKYTVTDSWGYGMYEAAMYLNSLDNASELIVWSDRDGLCQFFVGRCISPHKIDRDHTKIDYFVFSRRGVIRRPFSSNASDESKKLDRDYYYSDTVLSNPAWELHINDRPENFIKIIKVVD